MKEACMFEHLAERTPFPNRMGFIHNHQSKFFPKSGAFLLTDRYFHEMGFRIQEDFNGGIYDLKHSSVDFVPQCPVLSKRFRCQDGCLDTLLLQS